VVVGVMVVMVMIVVMATGKKMQIMVNIADSR